MRASHRKVYFLSLHSPALLLRDEVEVGPWLIIKWSYRQPQKKQRKDSGFEGVPSRLAANVQNCANAQRRRF